MKSEKQKITEYSVSELCASAVRECVCILFLFQSVCGMCRAFSGWEIPPQTNVRMQILLLLVAVLYEFTPLCRKYRSLAVILIEILCFLGAGLYLYGDYEKLQSGQKALYSDYIRYWNHYYKTNYIGYDSEKYLLVFLAALVFSLFLVFIIFRYITGIRLFLVIPGIAALVPGLLVNVRPQWLPLCFFFMGILLIYSGPERKSKIIFQVKDSKKNEFRHKATIYSVPFVVSALSIGILIISSVMFSRAANKIPEKNKEVMRIQNGIEDKIKSLSKKGFSLSKDWARVDNQTPKYSGEEVLTIYASEKPDTNLYLKNFYSGTYNAGKWESEKKAFREAARQAGFDVDFGLLLHQMYLDDLKKSDMGEMADYRIEYNTSFSKDAFVPYFTDLKKAGKDVWVEDEGLVRKNWGVKSLMVSGLTENIGNFMYVPEKTDSRKLRWYDQYVKSHYLKGSKMIPALDEFKNLIEAREIPVSVEYASLLDNTAYQEEQDEDVLQENVKRMFYAEQVRNLLDQRADYNLYLNEIPADTDTIQYFLESGREGYCMHFASAGTLLLQELGIPARYASGYVVENGAFHKEGNGFKANVRDRNAHAWTEIYLDRTGWIPFEMTPGYLPASGSGLPTDEDRQEALKEKHDRKNNQKNEETGKDSQKNEETQVQQNSETESEQPTENSSETEQNPTTGDKNTQKKSSDENNKTNKYVFIGLFLFFAVLVVLAAVSVYGMQKYHTLLAQDLKNERNRHAVKRINRRIYQGIRTIRTLTDKEYMEKLIEKYPQISGDEWKNYMKIVQKVAFSKEKITKEEAMFCYKCYKNRKQKR